MSTIIIKWIIKIKWNQIKYWWIINWKEWINLTTIFIIRIKQLKRIINYKNIPNYWWLKYLNIRTKEYRKIKSN
jgi:hypothetical protein